MQRLQALGQKVIVDHFDFYPPISAASSAESPVVRIGAFGENKQDLGSAMPKAAPEPLQVAKSISQSYSALRRNSGRVQMKVATVVIGGCLFIGCIGDALGQSSTGTKICSPSHDPGWRYAAPVPGAWLPVDCSNWAASQAANRWQLGCTFDGVPKFSWGKIEVVGSPPTPAAIPNPNCGW
jgi:hypothetical protein